MAFLMLNKEGLRQLVAETLDASNPDPQLLVPQNCKPAAIYWWATWARSGLVTGIPLTFDKMWSPMYQEADILSPRRRPMKAFAFWS